MADEKNLKQVGEQWLAIFEEKLKKAIAKREIGVTGTLAASFIKTIIYRSNGDPDRLQISFLMYGRFVDMGVGRGSRIGERHQQNLEKRAGLRAIARYPKKWYSKTVPRQVAVFNNILKDMYGVQMIHSFESSIDNLQVKINI